MSKKKKNREKPEWQRMQEQARQPILVTQEEFAPIGADHKLQSALTTLMHNLVMEDGRLTLAELGYLHMSALWFNQETQNIELNVYFDARLTLRKSKNPVNGEVVFTPVDELNIFRNYLFTGPLNECVSVEKTLAPKFDIVEDKMGRASLQFKGNSKHEEIMALVLHCAFPIAIAAALDVTLFDENFDIKVMPVASGAAGADSIVRTVSNKLIPLAVKVTFTVRNMKDAVNTYDPDTAVPYLQSLIKDSAKAEDNREKIVEKVAKKAKKEKERNVTVQKSFSDFA